MNAYALFDEKVVLEMLNREKEELKVMRQWSSLKTMTDKIA